MPFSARWYTLLHMGSPNDIHFYMEACTGARSVLELGAGAGRITFPLVHMGLDVTAVDISEHMIEALTDIASRLPENRRSAVTILQADMTQFRFETCFDRIIIPYNSLLCLLSEADVVACLRQSALHLKDDGVLIFDFYDVPLLDSDEVDEVDEDGDLEEHIATIEDGPQRAHVYECPISQPDPRRFDVGYRYIIVDENNLEQEQFMYEIAQRCIYKEELPSLIAQAGLEIVSMIGDFEDAPVDDETQQVVVTARKIQ